MQELTLAFKEKIVNQLKADLEAKALENQQQLEEIRLESANETKSSAGDKYETQREMIKQSRDLLDLQVHEIGKKIQKVNSLNSTAQDLIKEGSLILINGQLIFICIAHSKLLVDYLTVQLISTDAPLFKALEGKKINESAVLNGKKWLIEGII